MNITGPFFDKAKRGRKACWYLSVTLPKKNPDGTIALNAKGRAVLKRWRPYYETKEAAAADKPALTAQHSAAGSKVGPGGVLTRDQAAEFDQAKEILGDFSLIEAVKFWRLHHPLQKTKSLQMWVDPFLEDVLLRLGKTWQHYDLKSRLKRLCAAFGTRIPNTIQRDEAMNYLKAIKQSGRSILNHKNACCNFFNFLIEKGSAEKNPFGGIKKKQLPKIEMKEIEFLSLRETRAHLRACERYDPELVAHEIIQLFAGVRADDEMGSFRGEWVMPDTREIVVPGSVAKKERREVLNQLEDNFWEWWKAYGRLGRIRPINYKRRFLRVRILARLPEAEADGLASVPLYHVIARPEFKQLLRKWPWNARRRTFCTFHVAKHQSADRTALILRQIGGAETLHNSYRGLGVNQAEGIEFFNLWPSPIPNDEKSTQRSLVTRQTKREMQPA